MASNSPRRREMLAWVNWDWDASAANIDESQLPDETDRDYVIRLAAEKANFPIPEIQPPDIVIAADTIVVLDEKILGKPVSSEQAHEMLTSLCGREHQVMTAITVQSGDHGNTQHDICKTSVKMREYTDQEIKLYIASGDSQDKAGAYAIQNPDFHPVIDFNGCFASVMGMPLCHLERSLRELPNYVPRDLAKICQNHLKYNCPITERVMAGEDIG
ncbi:MAG: Maf family protein [Anaerolineaceae bacterium]|nr:Maf family protein [Anaerolineaceae bacterium]